MITGLIQTRPIWDQGDNNDANRWSRIHPRCLTHDGCVVDLGCLGWNKNFFDYTSDNWSGYFFDKKRVIGSDPQELPHPKADFFKGFVSNFNGRANLTNEGHAGAISSTPDGDYEVISWQNFKLKFNITNISILKVNIEGAEIDLFNSFSESDFKNIDQIAVSFHDWLYPEIKNDCEFITEKIMNHNFSCTDLGIYGWKLFLKK